MVDIVPVDVAEESMGHNLLGIGRARAQSQLWFASQQLLQDRDRIARHVDGIKRLISQDSIVDFIFVITAERGLLEKHLVDKHTESPPVDRPPILLVQKNLRGLAVVSLCQLQRDCKYAKHTSGAMNSGVPQNVPVVHPYHISSLHRP